MSLFEKLQDLPVTCIWSNEPLAFLLLLPEPFKVLLVDLRHKHLKLIQKIHKLLL